MEMDRAAARPATRVPSQFEHDEERSGTPCSFAHCVTWSYPPRVEREHAHSSPKCKLGQCNIRQATGRRDEHCTRADET